MFEKGCWISDAYQLHGLCRGEVKNRIKTYDSGRNLRPGDDLEEGEDEHIGACKIGEKKQKKHTATRYPSGSSVAAASL